MTKDRETKCFQVQGTETTTFEVTRKGLVREVVWNRDRLLRGTGLEGPQGQRPCLVFLESPCPDPPPHTPPPQHSAVLVAL